MLELNQRKRKNKQQASFRGGTNDAFPFRENHLSKHTSLIGKKRAEERGKSHDLRSSILDIVNITPFPPPIAQPLHSLPTAKMFRTAPRMAGYVCFDSCSC